MATDTSAPYIGRFAPSPTGPLHLGSLISALASYLDARSVGGQWLLRIEDLDPPRETPGASDAIIHCLHSHGLEWDGEILYQNQRSAAYDGATRTLLESRQAFYCDCSRRDIHDAGGIYPGTCRHRHLTASDNAAVRLKTTPGSIRFTDRLQGDYAQDVADTIGDFVIRRRDGLYAYQLAVVVDDIYQGITDIVRGSDLLDSTPRQITLQHLLGVPTPRYLHVPVLTNAAGEKLSKQTFAAAIDDNRAIDNLRFALGFLGQDVPTGSTTLPRLLNHAISHWRPAGIPARLAMATPE